MPFLFKKYSHFFEIISFKNSLIQEINVSTHIMIIQNCGLYQIFQIKISIIKLEIILTLLLYFSFGKLLRKYFWFLQNKKKTQFCLHLVNKLHLLIKFLFFLSNHGLSIVLLIQHFILFLQMFQNMEVLNLKPYF